ncbi:hypothetical protein FIBSPDRAFT_893094 [Athelia psychrophila]|uniref:SAP domain-containing protein n=1 Tax=Athelia psychrophila TaxID=1759441 RepID=A0A166HI32_9AGAM|nr:hypothetical protein FIBSPDRAFT_893094 [Fibularhizoctonia sp. CBS 109695]
MVKFEVLTLPIIGQTLWAGEEITTENLELKKDITKKILQGYLKGFNLGTSGNQDILIQRLHSYANDKEQCIEQFKPSQSRIPGGATGSHVDKQSSKRIQETFGDSGTTIAEYPSKRAVLTMASIPSSQPGRHVKEMKGWASTILALSRTAELRLLCPSDGADLVGLSDLVAPTGSAAGMEDPKSNMTIRVMSRSLHQVEDKFDRLVDAILKLSEASCFSQPSAMAVKSVAPYVCPPPAEHITLAEHIAGQGIPVRYWDKLYTKRAGSRCMLGAACVLLGEIGSSSLRNTPPSPHQSPSGNATPMWTVHLKYQAILDRLRNKRQANERDLGTEMFVYKRDRDVTTQWRALLDADESIRVHWLAMQDESKQMQDKVVASFLPAQRVASRAATMGKDIEDTRDGARLEITEITDHGKKDGRWDVICGARTMPLDVLDDLHHSTDAGKSSSAKDL